MIFIFSSQFNAGSKGDENLWTKQFAGVAVKMMCGGDSSKTCLMLRNTCWEIFFSAWVANSIKTIFLPLTKEEWV